MFFDFVTEIFRTFFVNGKQPLFCFLNVLHSFELFVGGAVVVPFKGLKSFDEQETYSLLM